MSNWMDPVAVSQAYQRDVANARVYAAQLHAEIVHSRASATKVEEAALSLFLRLADVETYVRDWADGVHDGPTFDQAERMADLVTRSGKTAAWCKKPRHLRKLVKL